MQVAAKIFSVHQFACAGTSEAQRISQAVVIGAAQLTGASCTFLVDTPPNSKRSFWVFLYLIIWCFIMSLFVCCPRQFVCLSFIVVVRLPGGGILPVRPAPRTLSPKLEYLYYSRVRALCQLRICQSCSFKFSNMFPPFSFKKASKHMNICYAHMCAK